MLYRDNQNFPQKVIIDYKTIFNRFWKTLNTYAPVYPEVEDLKREVTAVRFNIILSDAHLNHLQKICRLFTQQKLNKPIILKLHQEFCIDLELFKRGATVSSSTEVYF